MHRRPTTPALALACVVLGATSHAQAEPDPCDPEATLPPCFDAYALWLPTCATRFATLAPARPLASGASTLLLATGLALRPVLLRVPSPDPAGREVHVVNATSTVT